MRMLQKQYTSFLNTPILNKQTGEKLGEIYDLIIDTKTGKIEAFWVKQEIFIGATKVLSLNDISECKIKIYVQDKDAIVNPQEILKVQKIIKEEFFLYLNKVQTLSGTKLGKVTDFFFDCLTGQIIQIQISKNFLGIKYAKRLIPFSEIYEIKKDIVILKNNYHCTQIKAKEVLDLSKAV